MVIVELLVASVVGVAVSTVFDVDDDDDSTVVLLAVVGTTTLLLVVFDEVAVGEAQAATNVVSTSRIRISVDIVFIGKFSIFDRFRTF